MELTYSGLQSKIVKALNSLIQNDRYLLHVDANERTLSCRLAVLLKAEFSDWDVDCEYNRDGHDPKRIHLAPESIRSDDDMGVTVYPDIIIHQRGEAKNLLCIEIKKKSSSQIDKNRDLYKLEKYKSQLGYQFSAFIELLTGTPDVAYELDLRSNENNSKLQ